METSKKVKMTHLIMKFILCLVEATVKERSMCTVLKENLSDICCLFSRGCNTPLTSPAHGVRKGRTEELSHLLVSLTKITTQKALLFLLQNPVNI